MAESMSDEELMAALSQSPASALSDEELMARLRPTADDTSVVPAPIAEFASGANRALTQTADFFTADPINTVSGLVGSDFRVPTFTGAAQSVGIGKEGFMEPGLAQQVVSTAGEYAPAVVSMATQASGIPGAVERMTTNWIEGLRSGSPQAQALAKRLTESPKFNATVAGIKQGDAAQARKMLSETGEVVKDTTVKKAGVQGFDEGVLSAIRSGSVQDKKVLRRILRIREAGLKNQRTGLIDRASDVVGDRIKSRLDVIVKKNKEAGQRIGREAESLRDETLDFSQSIDQFFDDLAKEGVNVTDEGVEFADSRFEDLAAAERIIKVIVKRAERLSESMNAKKAHDLKQFIDEQVSFGKSEGLTGKAESIVKSLRANIDGQLDDAYDGYRKANQEYADTIEVINNLQSAAGNKINITGKNANKALGTLARGVMSNNRGRQELLNVLDDLQSTATKYGGKFDDDILLQALFVDELDTVFKPAARTSLAGDTAKNAMVDAGTSFASGDPSGGIVSSAARYAGDKLKGRNQENALKAIREFLEQ